MIKVLIGNILDSKMQTIVNTVNCVGVMGKGIAKEFKDHYPRMYKEYASFCRNGVVKLGVPYIYKDLLGTSIINFPTKDHWRSDSKFEDIVNGMKIFEAKYKEWGVQSVAFPPLGCGNGGLFWRDVGPILYQSLLNIDIPIELYAPFSTKLKYLKPEFLMRSVPFDKKTITQRVQKRVRPEWVCLLEVIFHLYKREFTQPIGRTKYQKLCYILSDLGIPMEFSFAHGSYGPYSKEAKDALLIFSNANLITETRLGSMIALNIGSGYAEFRTKHKDVLTKYKDEMLKAFDLFCRISDTSQAEEVATVLFISRDLQKKESHKHINEKDIYDEVFKWKKKWNNPEKQENIASTIRNLLILDWIDVSLSRELPMEEEIYDFL